MSLDAMTTTRLEMAHVLFMDIVGYSQLEMAEQRSLLGELQEVVRTTPEFSHTSSADGVLRLPTGDGMALVFFNDPVAPVRSAIFIATELTRRSHLRVRMGLHSGPVYRVEDINANANVSGGGINIAQRVMDCGDAGHILLSRAIREIVSQVGAWPLHDLGECEVKHGEKVHLYNLYTEAVGNSQTPRKLLAEPPVRTPRAVEFAAPAASPASGLRVALLYKRHAEPDGHLLQLLERGLTEKGHSIFIDRHMTIGVEWAKEIEQQIRSADAVIPLLSPASIQSEMLEWEVQHAHQAAQEQEANRASSPCGWPLAGPCPKFSPASSIRWNTPSGKTPRRTRPWSRNSTSR